MNKTERLRHLFERYVNNTCTRGEMDEFFGLVEDSSYDGDLKNVMDELWEGHFQPVGHKPDWTSVQAEQQTSRYPYWKMVVAASVTAIAALVFAVSYWQPSPEQLDSAEEVVQVVSKSTRDERRMITLPDGSTVWINRDSKLDFPLEFSDNQREVKLIGEAFFDIRRDTLRPFIIYSGKVTTVVLGTAFNIRAFPEENAVTVTVASGRVIVRDDEKNESILEANQQISFSPSEPVPTPYIAEADSVSEWIHQDLVLDNITFEEAATVIEKRYSVNVDFTSEALTGCRFTSTFLHGASLEQMLTAICIVNRATFTVHDGIVVISGEGCDTETRTD